MARYNGRPGGGMNMQSMMQQAQRMQQAMIKKQEEIEAMEFSATSGGGAVTAVVTGAKLVKEIKISPEAVDPDDVEMLEDMITAAVNEALRAADETSQAEMSKVTGGVNMGRMF